MVRLNRKLKAGVLTSLLIAPTAIANAQENDAQSRVTTQSEQVAYTNEVAAATTKEQLIAQFGKLSENSSADELVIAKGDLEVLNAAGFNEQEIVFIKAKYNYVKEQRRLLIDLQAIGTEINKVTYNSKTFFKDVSVVETRYNNFLNPKDDNSDVDPEAKPYLIVQNEFEKALSDAYNNTASSIASTVRGMSLQYGYNVVERNAYFKSKGADIDRLNKLISDSAIVELVTEELNKLDLLDPTAINNFTTTYNSLTADQKKVVEAYNPENDTVTPFKKYKDALTGLSAADKVSSSIDQLMAKKHTDFSSATNFISAVASIEKSYNSLNEASKKLVTDYAKFEQYIEMANISKQITALRVSNQDAYRDSVSSLKLSYEGLGEKKEFVKNGVDLEIADANIKSAEKIEELINAINLPGKDKVEAIKEARKAYDAPPKTTGVEINPANVKKIVNNLAELTTWEKKYKASLNVDKLIDSIKPGDRTFESKTISAQAAFDKLAPEERTLVQNKDRLELLFSYANLSKQIKALKPTMKDYEIQLAKLQSETGKLNAGNGDDAAPLAKIKSELELTLDNFIKVDENIEAVEDLISKLGKSENIITDILAARVAYDNLPSAAKSRVTNIKELTNKEKSYKSVVNVITQFEKLDSSSKSYISKAKSAFTAYAKLDNDNQKSVLNYKELNKVVPVIDVIVQISALNPSKKTYKDDVKKATDAYNGLDTQDPSLKEQVLNYPELPKAQSYIEMAKAFDDRVTALANEGPDTFVKKVAELAAEYKAMDKNAQKLVEQAKTLSAYEKSNKDVVKVIQMIDALNPTNKDYTKKVLDARKAYNALDQVSQKRVTNYANLTAVEDVASLIGLISSLKPTSKTFYQDMKTAREIFDALPKEKQAAIVNYDALVAAENEQGLAQSVIELINLTEEQDADYLTKLMNARVAYDKLSSNQKKLVTNIKDLTTREKAVKPIISVMVQINELDPESKSFVSKVSSARKAYDKLSKDQKKYIDNIDVLLKYEPVSNVMDLISKLKSSSNTFLQDTSRARSLYDALPADMKQYVTNYYLLQAAETSILGAGNVMQMIEDLPSVDPKQYVKRVQEIRAAYNALPKDQQRAVQNYRVLQDQEKLIKPVISVVEDIDRLLTAKDMNSQYQKILKAYDKLNADQRRYVYNDQLLLSLDNVIKVYNNIAKLNPKDKYYFGMVEAVRKEYDSLNTTDKQRISNYSILLEAEKSMADVKKVVELIAGLSPSSPTYIEDVANAVAAYKALDSKMRGQVINEDVLKQAEKDVASVLKVVQAIGSIDPDSSSFEKKVLSAQKDYSALSIEQQGLVYNYRILEEYLKMIE